MQALKLVSTNAITHDEWLEIRRTGIGGSDVSAICNMNRYRSPVAVYLDKVGELPPIEETEPMYWGRVLEDVVATEFTVRTGYRVRKNNFVMRHRDYPWMLANIDRWIVGQNAGLECKTANEYAKDDWRGETVPKEYALQCHHYMAITGADRWYVAVLIGGNKFEWRVIERDEDIIRDLIEIEMNFWNEHVVKRIPPAFGAHDHAMLGEIYPIADDHKKIDLTPFRDDVMGLLNARDNLREAEFTFEDFKAKIKGHMGMADLGYFNDELLITWKNGAKSRQFRIKGEKN